MLASRPVRTRLVFRLERSRPPIRKPSMKRISSRDNADFKRFMAVRGRKERGLILVEGERLLEEAVKARLRIEITALDETAAKDPSRSWGSGTRICFADPLFRSLTGVETSQGVIAIIERPTFTDSWLHKTNTFVLILDGVQDPGNVGALIRTAEAAGVDGVLMTEGCADPLSPKALRSSAGSALRLPHLRDLTAAHALERLPPGTTVMAMVAASGAPSLFDAPMKRPLALALGSEGKGLSAELERAATLRVRIPQARPVESLNVAAAAAIALFEIAGREGALKN